MLINFSGFGLLVMNFIMAPGGINVDDLITSKKKGLYINYFRYTRLVQARPCPRFERRGL